MPCITHILMHSCLQLAGPEKGWIILKLLLLYHLKRDISNVCLHFSKRLLAGLLLGMLGASR